MKKFQLDQSILADMNAVQSDSFKDNISMIEVEKLKPSIDNFYSMSDIEILAEDIERQGLKHNLVVTEDADCIGTYFIKSGHRRYKAVKFLMEDGRYTSRYVPCLIDGIKSKNENILDLVMLNATSRVMTDSELYHQYEVLKDIIKQMELEGKKFKGRMREKIAKLLDISPAQIGKIENIKNHAIPEIKEAVEDGTISITKADKIAKLTESEQKELTEEKNLSEVKTSDIQPKKKPERKVYDEDSEEIFEWADSIALKALSEKLEELSEKSDTIEDEVEIDTDDTAENSLKEYRSRLSYILKDTLYEVNHADSVDSLLSIISKMQEKLEIAKEVI